MLVFAQQLLYLSKANIWKKALFFNNINEYSISSRVADAKQCLRLLTCQHTYAVWPTEMSRRVSLIIFSDNALLNIYNEIITCINLIRTKQVFNQEFVQILTSPAGSSLVLWFCFLLKQLHACYLSTSRLHNTKKGFFQKHKHDVNDINVTKNGRPKWTECFLNISQALHYMMAKQSILTSRFKKNPPKKPTTIKKMITLRA